MPRFEITEFYSYSRSTTVQADTRDEAQDIAESYFDVEPSFFQGSEKYNYEDTIVEEVG